MKLLDTLTQEEINSTSFPYITSGVKEVCNKPLELCGIGGSLAVFKISNTSSEISVTFIGKVNTPFECNPGIFMAGGTFNPYKPAGQPNSYELLLTFTGRLWIFLKTSWTNPITTLPLVGTLVDNWVNTTKPFNYTVVLDDVNNSIFINYVILNGERYIVNYPSPIPWNFTYIGIVIDFSRLTICSFYASNVTILSPHQPYIVYVNGKEYITGYTNCFGEGSFTLFVSSPSMVVNISFPLQHKYRIIAFSASDKANVQVKYPWVQYALLAISVVLVTISLLIERKKGGNR